VFQKLIGFLKGIATGSWKPTITAIFGIIIGVCLSIVLACGQVLREAIMNENSSPDLITRFTAVATRDSIIIGLGLLSLVILAGAIYLAVMKFRTAAARQRWIQRSYDRQDGAASAERGSGSAGKVITLRHELERKRSS